MYVSFTLFGPKYAVKQNRYGKLPRVLRKCLQNGRCPNSLIPLLLSVRNSNSALHNINPYLAILDPYFSRPLYEICVKHQNLRNIAIRVTSLPSISGSICSDPDIARRMKENRFDSRLFATHPVLLVSDFFKHVIVKGKSTQKQRQQKEMLQTLCSFPAISYLQVVNLREYNSIHEHGLWLDCTRHSRDGNHILQR